MTTEEMIAVLQAHKEGKTIQAQNRHTRYEWYDREKPVWDFENYDYRVKPEPKVPREFWVHPTRIVPYAGGGAGSEWIHVREVLEEQQ